MPKIVDIEKIQADYRQIAKDYDTKWKVFHDMPHHWILGYAEKPRSIIDLGCGTGLLLAMLQARYPDAKITGIDCSADMLEFASERIDGGDLYVADIENMDIPEDPFHLVLSVNVLHHLNDPQAHIDLLHKLCAHDGTVFLCDLVIEGWKLMLLEQYWRLFHQSHHRAFTHDELKPLLADKFTFQQDSFLSVDSFWRLQIYKLKKITPPSA